MCEFFSLISDGKGKIYYFDAKVRKEIIANVHAGKICSDLPQNDKYKRREATGYQGG